MRINEENPDELIESQDKLLHSCMPMSEKELVNKSMNAEIFLDALLGLPVIDDELWPQVSPDGRWVVWTWFQTGPAADVFAVPSDGSSPPVRLTDTDQDTFFVSWTRNSQSIVVEQDQDGDERVQLFRVDLNHPLVMHPLTEPHPNYYIQGGFVHPKNNWLVYGANVHPRTGLETEETYIYRHDLTSRERAALAKPEKAAYTVPKLNSLGTHILYGRKDLHPAGQQIWLVDINGSDDREIFNFGDSIKTYADWHPDGSRVVLLAETPTHYKVGIWELGNSAVHWLVDDPARDIQAAFVPENSQDIVIVEDRQGRVSSSLFNINQMTEIEMTGYEGNLIPLAPITGEKWVGFYYSARQPGDIVQFDRADIFTSTFTSFTSPWKAAEIQQEQLASAEDFNWQSSDGLEIHGWLYRPSGDLHGTIVYVHGGPNYHSRDYLNPEIQFLVSQGFNVFDPNYRGSTGYGLPFQQAILEDGWGGREQDDIRTGIEALIHKGIASPNRIGITGTSYGGYSSWWAITHFPPEIVAAAAPICGMTDLVVDYETTRPDLRPFSIEMMGGTPKQVPELYRQRSPLNFVENIKGKLLIVQGANDPNVTPENVTTVLGALDRNKISYELLVFEDEGHGIHKLKNKRTLYLRLAAFFKEAFS